MKKMDIFILTGSEPKRLRMLLPSCHPSCGAWDCSQHLKEELGGKEKPSPSEVIDPQNSLHLKLIFFACHLLLMSPKIPFCSSHFEFSPKTSNKQSRPNRLQPGSSS